MSEISEFLLALDIDHTLAEGVVAAHLQCYNQMLGLGMTDQEVQLAAATYPRTFDIPEIQAYRQKNEDKFQEIRQYIRTSPEVTKALSLIEGVNDAVSLLYATCAQVAYYSVRPSENYQATTEWLTAHELPNPESIVLCDGHREKLLSLLQKLEEQNTNGILIDDSIKELIAAAQGLIQEDPNYQDRLQRMILVGFAIQDAQKQYEYMQEAEWLGLNVLCLPSWDLVNVSELLEQIERF